MKIKQGYFKFKIRIDLKYPKKRLAKDVFPTYKLINTKIILVFIYIIRAVKLLA